MKASDGPCHNSHRKVLHNAVALAHYRAKAKELIAAVLAAPSPRGDGGPPVNLAGLKFADKDALWAHCHKLIERIEEDTALAGLDAVAFQLEAAQDDVSELSARLVPVSYTYDTTTGLHVTVRNEGPGDAVHHNLLASTNCVFLDADGTPNFQTVVTPDDPDIVIAPGEEATLSGDHLVMDVPQVASSNRVWIAPFYEEAP